MSEFTYSDRYLDDLTIEADTDNGDPVAAIKTGSGATVYVPTDVAPSVAVAILESASATSLNGAVAQAVVCLRNHLTHVATEKAAQEAVEAAKAAEELRRVDEEALALINVLHTHHGFPVFESLDGLDEPNREGWRKLAREARSINAER